MLNGHVCKNGYELKLCIQLPEFLIFKSFTVLLSPMFQLSREGGVYARPHQGQGNFTEENHHNIQTQLIVNGAPWLFLIDKVIGHRNFICLNLWYNRSLVEQADRCLMNFSEFQWLLYINGYLIIKYPTWEKQM